MSHTFEKYEILHWKPWGCALAVSANLSINRMTQLLLLTHEILTNDRKTSKPQPQTLKDTQLYLRKCTMQAQYEMK